MKFSVLISIYSKESAVYFRQALQSILKQTVMPDEIILVKDGLLTWELEEVIDDFQNEVPSLLNIVPLKENKGLGLALRIGLLHCSYDIVFRMDSDDISMPERFEKQLKFFEKHEDIALVGTYIGEFSEDIQTIDMIRKVPLEYEKIRNWARHRNPLNHVTVGFRKDAVLAAGNYCSAMFHEDYDLWVRMIQNDFHMSNLPEVLVLVRANYDKFRRCGGIVYIRHMFRFQKKLRRQGFISTFEFIRNIAIRATIGIIPNSWRMSIYRLFLRNLKA